MADEFAQELTNATRNGNLAEMERLIKAGADVNSVASGHAALLWAAETKNPAAAKLLLDNGALADRAGPNGWTPLMSAAWHNTSEVATLLLEKGASAHSRDKDGRTPIKVATEKGFGSMVQLLQQSPDEIIYNDRVYDRVLQEVYSFRRKERFTFVRKSENGDIEAVQRESFSDLVDKPGLRKAFNEHKRRGGKMTEEEVFENALPKKSLARPSQGLTS